MTGAQKGRGGTCKRGKKGFLLGDWEGNRNESHKLSDMALKPHHPPSLTYS